MSKLDRDREPQLLRPEPPRAQRQPTQKRRGSWLRSVVVVVVLGACGVAGYLLADGIYLASQRPAPTPSQPATPPPVESTEVALAEPPAAAPDVPVAAPVARTIGTWTLVCPGNNVPRADCALVQRLVDAEKHPLLVWSVTRDTDGTVRAMWQTPTNIDRQGGLVLDAGDGRPRTVPIAACAEQYCLVRGILAPAYLTTLAAAPRVTVAVNDPTGKPTTYAFNLAGLADGLAWLGGSR